MKLSTKGRYSVTALYHIALDYGKGPVSLKSISERQGVSDSYLEQLFITLKKAGFVNIKGHRSVGGFRASCYNAMPLEGVQALVDCMKEFEANH